MTPSDRSAGAAREVRFSYVQIYMETIYDLASTTFVQTVETAAFVVTPPVTPSSPGGNHWLGAALHTPEKPLSHWACSRWLGCPL